MRALFMVPPCFVLVGVITGPGRAPSSRPGCPVTFLSRRISRKRQKQGALGPLVFVRSCKAMDAPYPVRRLRISWRMTRSRRETCTWVMPSFSAVACWVWRLRYRSTMRARSRGSSSPEHLLQGQPVGDRLLRRGDRKIDLFPVILLPPPGSGIRPASTRRALLPPAPAPPRAGRPAPRRSAPALPAR